MNATTLHRIFAGIVLSIAVLPTVKAQNLEFPMTEVLFWPTTERSDLDSIADAMKVMGIELVITSAEYKNGSLRSIDYAVTTDRGSGTASGKVTQEQPMGFRYDPRPEAEVPFSIGTITRKGKDMGVDR